MRGMGMAPLYSVSARQLKCKSRPVAPDDESGRLTIMATG